ncbi:MAG TPA: hypothetical protein VFQ22_01530, partial [Longimicrobiales bacterium]|nr:hypothetical protein [Longimicrobiales bacterium]
MRKLAGSVLAAWLVAAPALAAQADPVALVVRVQGAVQVARGSAPAAPARAGDRLYAGDAVMPESGARAILITRAGSQRVVTERVTMAEPTAAAPADLFARAVATLAQAAATD